MNSIRRINKLSILHTHQKSKYLRQFRIVSKVIALTSYLFLVLACENPTGIDVDPIRFHIFSDYFPSPHSEGDRIVFLREQGPRWVPGIPFGILMLTESTNEISVIDTLGYGRPQWIDDAHIAYKTSESGATKLAIHNINDNTTSFLDYGEAQIFHILPSDSLIAFHAGDGRIRVYNLSNNELQFISTCCYSQPYWIPDTNHLLVSYRDTPHSQIIAYISTEDSNVNVITRSNDDRSDEYPCISSDGMSVAFQRLTGKYKIYRTDLTGSFEKFIGNGRYPTFDIDDSGLYYSKTTWYGYRIYYHSFTEKTALQLTK